MTNRASNSFWNRKCVFAVYWHKNVLKRSNRGGRYLQGGFFFSINYFLSKLYIQWQHYSQYIPFWITTNHIAPSSLFSALLCLDFFLLLSPTPPLFLALLSYPCCIEMHLGQCFCLQNLWKYIFSECLCFQSVESCAPIQLHFSST